MFLFLSYREISWGEHEVKPSRISYFQSTYCFCFTPWWTRKRAVFGCRIPFERHSSRPSPSNDPTNTSKMCCGYKDCSLPTVLPITLILTLKHWGSTVMSRFNRALSYSWLVAHSNRLGSFPLTQLAYLFKWRTAIPPRGATPRCRTPPSLWTLRWYQPVHCVFCFSSAKKKRLDIDYIITQLQIYWLIWIDT